MLYTFGILLENTLSTMQSAKRERDQETEWVLKEQGTAC
jgi:hypothetical protein